MREQIASAAGTSATARHAQHLLAAEGYLDLGMYREAGLELEALEPACFALEETLVLQLCVYAGLKQWKFAHELATTLSEQDPDNPQWTIWAASATCRLQSVEAAKGILLEAVKTHPDNANIHYNLSCYETRLNHFRKAHRHLARAIQLDPRFRAVAMDDADLEPLWEIVSAATSDD